MTDSNFKNQQRAQNQEDLEDKTMDPRDIVYKGGYRKEPREIIDNPAVTPEMLEENQGAREAYTREESNREC